jgi:hypothetical protein
MTSPATCSRSLSVLATAVVAHVFNVRPGLLLPVSDRAVKNGRGAADGEAAQTGRQLAAPFSRSDSCVSIFDQKGLPHDERGIGPGVQTSRPDDAGPVRKLLDG